MRAKERTVTSKEGIEWISTAPIGYLNVKGLDKTQNTEKIIVDQSRASLIKKLFEEYSTGNYSLFGMQRRLKQWGLRNSRGNKNPLSLSHINRIIQNPFYYGVIRISKTNKEFNHIYPTIISRKLFDQCQKVRSERLNLNSNKSN